MTLSSIYVGTRNTAPLASAMSMPSTISLPRTPDPNFSLGEFSPFVEWALFPIHYRSKLLGVDFPNSFIRWVLSTQATESTLSELHQSSSISSKDLIRIISVHDVVQQAGWLTWEEYCYLIVAGTWGEGGGALVHEWAKTPKRLEKELRYLETVMRYPGVKPYVPVLKKVIKRVVWEMEMMKKYPETMGLRNRKFEKGETTLDFNEEDIARDDKARREETQQANGEKSTSTGQDVESKSVSSEASQNGTSTDTSETSLLETANIDESATK